MTNEFAPRMSQREFFGYIDRAAQATDAGQVARLRLRLREHYKGDARADELCEALYEHELRLRGESGQLGALRHQRAKSGESVVPRTPSREGERPRPRVVNASSPSPAARASVRP
jgi:hypothetical protein